MLIVYMAMFGAARAVRKNEHTEVAGLAKALPKAGGIALRVLTNTIVLITIFIMIYGSFFLASRITTVTPVLRFKMSYNYYGIAVGSALMLYEYLKLMKTRILGR